MNDEFRLILSLALSSFVVACTPKIEPEQIGVESLATSFELFDDFNYSSAQALKANGWILRSERGWPGVEGASWGDAQFSYLVDPDVPENHLLRLSAQTDGTAKGTKQAQLCHARKYITGTYAARVRFSDEPVSGPDGDQVVQTFYTISPLKRDLDPDYSELDNEYLPNGGWGVDRSALFNTSWETVQLQPWQASNKSKMRQGSFEGWHTLVMHVASGKVEYFVDGKSQVTHAGVVYPRVPMSINFNLWFIREGLITGRETRLWQQDIDWVFYAKDKVMPPEDVERRVAGFRQLKVNYRDTVPALNPPFASACNM